MFENEANVPSHPSSQGCLISFTSKLYKNALIGAGSLGCAGDSKSGVCQGKGAG